ncbi:MAG: diguanylate cyclase [Arcobacter sp.]|nr:diguanylate cyclase [Arcobacter sp.]
MFKNTLFLKIIFVFLFPYIGMLYFNYVLISENNEILNQSSKIKRSISNIKDLEYLSHSLQKERGLSSAYLSSQKFTKELKQQRLITNKLYKELLKNSINISIAKVNNIKKIQIAISTLSLLRSKVDNFSITPFTVISEMSLINDLVLETIALYSKIKPTMKFDNRLAYINYLLIAKEQAAIQRGITTYFLYNKLTNKDKEYDLLRKSYIIEEINIKNFLLRASINEVEKYKKEVNTLEFSKILNIRSNLVNSNFDKKISVEEWLILKTKKIDALENVYEYISAKTLNNIEEVERKAYLSIMLSLTLLIVMILIIIILIYLLRQIILKEQRNISRIEKQQNVYALLNSANKLLIKSNTEKKIFKKICQLLSTNTNMSFSLIYKEIGDKFDLVFEQNNTKAILNNDIKIIEQVIKKNKYVMFNNLKKEKDFFNYELIKKYNLKSFIAFPVKKFGMITDILFIFSNDRDFFDKEILILFNNIIHNLEHALEKIDYENERKIQEDKLRIISYAFETNEPMLITDKDVNIINANNAFCTEIGYEKKDILGKKPSIFSSKYHSEDFYTNMWNMINKNGSWSGELYNTLSNNKTVPLLSTITAVKDENGIVKNYLAQYINISEQKDKQKLLEYNATHDYLTDLPNRSLLLDRLGHAIQRVIRHNIIGGLIFIDLDNFKAVNDTLGHDIGDKLLIKVSKSLKYSVRDEDTVSRIGGDEFVILSDCIGKTKEEAKLNIINLAEKIKFILNDIKDIEGHKNNVTPSIGITLFDKYSISATDIIKQADEAMYKAKKEGKNTIEFFE